jgi:multidrug efflux system outer membrane protein
MRTAPFAHLLSTAVLLVLTGCMVGPNYQKPAVATPTAYIETGPWKESVPRDHLPKGNWWTIYRDPVLDRLESQATAASPTIAGALARRDQARALARLDRAGLFPEISVNGNR